MEPQSFSFSKSVLFVVQVRTSESASTIWKKNENSYSSFEGEHRHFDSRWRTRLGVRVRQLRGVKIVFFVEWKTAASGPGRAARCVELVAKKGDGGSRKIRWKDVPSKVDIEALERLIEPEDEEVCLRYILKYSTRGSNNIFSFS